MSVYANNETAFEDGSKFHLEKGILKCLLLMVAMLTAS